MFSDGSLRRTTSQQQIEPASKRYLGIIAARGNSLKDHGQAHDDGDDHHDDYSERNLRKANSAWGNQMTGKQGNLKNKHDSCDEDVYSYIQEAYNKAQRNSGSKQQGSQEYTVSLAGGQAGGMDIHNYCENGMIPKEKVGGNFTNNTIENNSIMGDLRVQHGNSTSCDKSSEGSKQHRVSRLDEYRQTLKEQEQQNLDASCLRSQDNSKHLGSNELSEWGQQQHQEKPYQGQQYAAQAEKVKELLISQEQAQQNAISQYQSNNYQSVYNRDDFRLTEVMDMEKQIERLKILFEFFDIWDSGLVKREEQHQKDTQKEINHRQNNDKQLGKLQGSDSQQDNKDLEHADEIEELMSKMRVLSEREDQLDAFEKDLQQLRIESDAKGELIKKEMLQIEEDMELFFDVDGESEPSKSGAIRHSHEDANGIAASLEKRFASLRNKEQQVAEGEKEQCNIWEQLQMSRAGMEQHLKQLTVMEEQLSSEKGQLSQQLKEELSRLELLRVQANCVMNAQSSEQYMNKLQLRDAQLAIAEEKAVQKEAALINQIRAAKGQQQSYQRSEQDQQQHSYWQQQKQNSLQYQNQNVHTQQQPSFGLFNNQQHQNSALREEPQQFETLNEKNAAGGGQTFQLASQQPQQQQEHQRYQQQYQQQQRQPPFAYQQQAEPRFSNSSRETMHNNQNHLPPRETQFANSSSNRTCYEASSNHKEIPLLPITSSQQSSLQGGRGSGSVRMQDKILQQMILNQQQKHLQQQQQQGNKNQLPMKGVLQSSMNTKVQSEERKGMPHKLSQESNFLHSKSQSQILQEQYLNSNSRIPSTQQKYPHSSSSSSSSTALPSSSDKTIKSPYSQNHHEWEKFPGKRTPSTNKSNNENAYPMPPLQRQLRFP